MLSIAGTTAQVTFNDYNSVNCCNGCTLAINSIWCCFCLLFVTEWFRSENYRGVPDKVEQLETALDEVISRTNKLQVSFFEGQLIFLHFKSAMQAMQPSGSY